jgi:hypothetical protein
LQIQYRGSFGSYVQSGFSAFGSTLTSEPTPESEGSCCGGGGDGAIGGGNVAMDVAAAETLAEVDEAEEELDFLSCHKTNVTSNTFQPSVKS